ncbi:MAG: ABC-F family ATP-binding cassette domain-containing protein [Pirellulaceae bacterium]
MSLILSVQNLEKYYSDEPVLVDVSFEIRQGQRVSIVGPNGAGKTTLLRILMGQLEPDNGTIEFAKNAKFGFLEQRPEIKPGETVWQVAEKAIADIKQLESRANEVASRMAEASPNELDALTKSFDQLHAAIELRGGFNLDHKIERVLHGLGFRNEDFERPASLLSGGETNRLMLGLLLLEEPDLMLLDEPSNHLDIAATEWLEDFLRQSQQAFILVSHDRYFLDRVVNRTLELVNGSIDDYPGNFTKYLTLKEQRLEVQQRTFDKQQEEIAKIEDFIRRNHVGQKATQAEDRRKKLERIERVELPRSISLPNMRFPEPSRCGDIVLRVNQLEKSFDDKLLFSNVSFQIERGQRWGILGPNGCGKSTFLKCLMQQQSPSAGEMIFGTGVRIGYFDQKLQSVSGDHEAFEAVRPTHKQMIDRERRDLLALFGVTGDLALQRVSSLSGGERNRVALARLAAEDANFLIMDEPTNHLDIWSREALERALKQFDGTLLLVSHDRYFLNQLCSHLLVFEPGKVTVFEGNYDTFRMMEQVREQEEKQVEAASEKHASSRRANENKERRKRKFPYRKTNEIEQEIAEREASIEQIHNDLINPEILRDGNRVVELKQQLDKHQSTLEQLYEHWQEALELNG